MRLIDKVKRNLRKCHSLDGARRIVIAVSGGLDSMCLLDLAHCIYERDQTELIVAHFNHGLRGVASDEDAAFVRKCADKLGMPFREGGTDVASDSVAKSVSVEMAAREARHSFLANVARAENAPGVILAHHADDQVETFFLRLLRGGSSRGMGAMCFEGRSPADCDVRVIRPLLDVPNETLVRYAEGRRLEFRNDDSKQSRPTRVGSFFGTIFRQWLPKDSAASL